MSKSKNTRRQRDGENRDEVQKDKWLGVKGRQKKNWTKAWLDYTNRDTKENDEEPIY